MKAMILAAGQGKRMMPLTATTPKPLLRVGGHSLLEWQIRRLRRAGIQQIVINHNYLGEQIEAALGDGSRLDVSLVYSPENELLETAGGIVQALPLLGGDSFLVANGDVWTDYPFKRLLEHTRQAAWLAASAPGARPLAHLVLVPNAPHHPRGDFHLLHNGQVVDQWPGGHLRPEVDLRPELVQPPEAGYRPETDRRLEVDDGADAPPRLTYAGIALLRRELFNGVPPGPGRLAPLLRDAMRDGRVTGECYTGDWHDIGTPQRLNELDQALRASSARV